MATLFRPIVELWNRLTLGQRGGLILVLALVIAIVAGAVSYTTRPVLITLYSGMNARDAGQIVETLRGEKIPFSVSADGSTVKAPQEKVSELRLRFASEGLPRSGELGYELFDKPQIGMTDFVQRMNFHRALEGELARTITELEAVENARVHLVIPSPRLFREEQKPATASIIIQLHPGAMLSLEQVQSIAYLAAYSVEGLAVENITITDTRGNLLTRGRSANDAAGLTSTQMEVQSKIEGDLERKALSLLDNVLGPGRAQVKVTAALNWDRFERTVESYDADRAATLSEERVESSGAGTGGDGSSEKTVTNYQVPHTVEKYVPEVGTIKRLSASVLVDGDYRIQKDADGKEKREYVERSAPEIEKFRTLVATAIGFDAKRKDEITVVSIAFSEPEPVIDKDTKGDWLKIIEKAVLAILLLALLFVARSVLLHVAKHVGTHPSAALQAALASGGSMPMLTDRASGAPAGVLPSAAGSSSPPPATSVSSGPTVIFRQDPQTVIVEDSGPSYEAIKHQELLKRTCEYILSKPDSATQVLRSWILDESTEKFAR